MEFSHKESSFPVNAFTGRKGGVSNSPFDSLNFGVNSGDEPEKIRENFLRYRKGRNFNLPIVTGTQVHGTTLITVQREDGEIVASADGERGRGSVAEPFLAFGLKGDALFTEEKGLPIGVYTADCLPLVLSDLDKSFVMAVHCGWRGTVNGIVEKSLELLMKKGKKDVTLILGPSIGSCCFEMGAEHLHCFSEKAVVSKDNSFYIDLKGEVLERTGKYPGLVVRTGNIDYCTCCNSEHFFSYRRDSRTGRHLNLACL